MTKTINKNQKFKKYVKIGLIVFFAFTFTLLFLTVAFSPYLSEPDNISEELSFEEEKSDYTEADETADNHFVYILPGGYRYHFDPDCGGKNSYAVSIDNVGGRTPCQKCAQ